MTVLRRLLVMRHAKSSWKSGAASDHDRPLNKRGRAAAPRVAQALAELGWIPTAVVSSDAKRTRETWARCAQELPAPDLLRFTTALYHSDFHNVLAELSAVPDRLDTLLVLGHNPTWEHLVAWLSGRETVLKTADVALLEANLPSWRQGFEVPERWRLSRVLRSRELRIDACSEADS